MEKLTSKSVARVLHIEKFKYRAFKYLYVMKLRGMQTHRDILLTLLWLSMSFVCDRVKYNWNIQKRLIVHWRCRLLGRPVSVPTPVNFDVVQGYNSELNYKQIPSSHENCSWFSVWFTQTSTCSSDMAKNFPIHPHIHIIVIFINKITFLAVFYWRCFDSALWILT